MKAKSVGARIALIGLVTAVLCTIAGMGAAMVSKTGTDAYCNLCHEGGNGTDGTTTQTCVECHSSNTYSTTYELSGGGEIVTVPVVNYTGSEEPSTYLAGGNFYWVVNLGDSYGHNVRDISDKDGDLDVAPGGEGHTCADWSCHGSLTYPDTVHGHLRINGCRGCHYTVMHHGDDPQGQVVGPDGGWYRFLCPDHDPTKGGGGVAGIEDPGWEENPTAAQHNSYYGVCDKDDHWVEPQAMSDYCSGCHQAYHAPGWWADNGGGEEPWHRHPSDWPLPASGEYASYTVYDPLVPVARPDLSSFDAPIVRPGTDIVMCLSCHRAHGSPYPKMLRWDLTGCLNCHKGTGR